MTSSQAGLWIGELQPDPFFHRFIAARGHYVSFQGVVDP